MQDGKCWSSSSDGLYAIQFSADPLLCALHVEVRLKVHPELRGLTQIFSEAKRDISGHRSGTFDNMTDSHRRHANIMRKTSLGYAEFLYNFLQYHAGMHRLKISPHYTPPF